MPVERTNITPEERKLLADPDWVTEDEADVIIGLRGEKAGEFIPFDEVAKRYGYQRKRRVGH